MLETIAIMLLVLWLLTMRHKRLHTRAFGRDSESDVGIGIENAIQSGELSAGVSR